MQVRLLDAEETRHATSTGRYLAALFDPRGGDLHPMNYARGLAAAAQSVGASIHGNSRVISVKKQSGKWRLRTDRATVSADKLLVVTNAYADNLWPDLRTSLVPVYSSIVATKPLPGDLAARILPQRPVLFESGHITVYYRLDRQNRLLMVAVDRSGHSRANRAARLSQTLRRKPVAGFEEHPLAPRLERPIGDDA
jgi:glycine/D-amino acid oxidase-like deaminating enzyme